MNKKKLLAVLLCAVLLILPFTATAGAAATGASGLFGGLGDLFGEGSPFGDLLNGLMESLGGNGENGSIQLSDLFSNPNGVLDTIRERLGSTLSNAELIEAISDLLGGAGSSFSVNDLLSNEFLNRLRKYLGMAEVTEEPTTAPTTTAAPTEPPTTAAPVTTQPPQTVYYYYVPSTAATTSFSGAQTYSVPTAAPTTEAPYSYIPPEIVTVAPLTTQPSFTPSVVDEDTTVKAGGGSTVKTVIGVVILVLSLAAVVVVAVILRKSKI